jgi:hypothetical protein
LRLLPFENDIFAKELAIIQVAAADDDDEVLDLAQNSTLVRVFYFPIHIIGTIIRQSYPDISEGKTRSPRMSGTAAERSSQSNALWLLSNDRQGL